VNADDETIREGKPPVNAGMPRASAEPDSSSFRIGCSSVCSVAGIALSAVLLWGFISDEAFPILDSTGVPGSGSWVCPVALLAGVCSTFGLVTGLAALGRVGAKASAKASFQTWTAVLLNAVVIVWLVSFVMYCLNRGLMS
jgi:hypothetical protein